MRQRGGSEDVKRLALLQALAQGAGRSPLGREGAAVLFGVVGEDGSEGVLQASRRLHVNLRDGCSEDAKATVEITSQTRAVTATTRALDLIIQFIHFGIAGQTYTTVCEALK